MNSRQKIRAMIVFLILCLVGYLSLMTAIYPIYLDVLKNLSLPFTIVLSGYFGTEIAKNIKK